MMPPMVEMPDAAAIYDQFARAGARPDPPLLVSEWADQYRILNARSSSEPGPWRTSRVPYLKDIMDDLSPISPVEQIVFEKGAQLGGTEAGNNWTGFVMHYAPGPMLSVQPTVDMAKRNSKQRLAPLIADSPILRELVKDPRKRDSGNTLLSKEFPGGILVLVGANSAKPLRSMPTRYLFLDEVDGYPGDVDGEGDPCLLAIARTTNYPRRKIFIISTPAVSGRSRIESFYAESDMRQYWVPCPHCDTFQVLIWTQLRWTAGQPATARYHCEGCGKPIENVAKEQMLARGEWRPRRQSPIRGYHLSSLYSPVGWLTWPQIADKREKAGSDAEKLQIFHNTILGEPWTDAAEVPDAERLYERREGYEIGVVPRGGLLLTCGVDVQARRLELEIVAWGRNKESWSIDYRVIEGEPSQPWCWKKLGEVLDEEFPTEYGKAMRIKRMAIDSGYATMNVYDFVRRASPGRAMAIKGQVMVPTVVGVPRLLESGPAGQRLKYGIRLWPVNVNIAKEELYRWLRTSVPDVTRGERWPAGFCHFPQYSKEYFEQLTAEVLVTRSSAGRRVSNWEKRRDRNEALDCRIYARAAAGSMRFEAWKDSRWDQLEQSVTSGILAQPRPERSESPASNQASDQPRAPQFKAFRAKQDFLE